ncbi:CDP-alcohol phosphatidyltransferase [Hamiltosporidium magnivora]|uniref:CDP-diacylglycerol--inositol 3-phosphatidyltransferase n=1 Tax=Hamiltosporidium magnivora TaxID=148818 RepID=A0A4Q9LFA9_9MICR|nr:CDP-alcohol phosphatidyltransferase [Hamiltosporidium magnivora]
MKYSALFFIPNLICYLRFILLIVAIFFEKSTFILFYSISAILDALDGYSARKLNQCTLLGSILDMAIDRISTVIILIKIGNNIPTLTPYLSVCISIDLLSHFLHFSSSLLQSIHHKSCKSKILEIYYRRRILFLICFFVEMFYICCYCTSFISRMHFFCIFFGIFWILKTFLHFIQMINALKELAILSKQKKKK